MEVTDISQTPASPSSNLTREFLPAPPEKHRLFHRILHWEYFWLSVLVVLLLAMHFSLVYQQAHPFYLFQKVGGPYSFIAPDQVIFDEAHYINNSSSIINGEGDLRC